MKTNLPLVVLALAVLTACSTSPYHPKSALTGGYTDAQVAPDVYRIVYEGAADASTISQVKDLALRRAAEICLDAKCAYFLVTEQSDETSAAYSRSSSASGPAPSVAVKGTGSRAAAASEPPAARVVPTLAVVPRIALTIRLAREKPSDPAALEAGPLFERLRRQYP